MGEYKRLTHRLDGRRAIAHFDREAKDIIDQYVLVVRRLAELEDKIENGELVELPRIVHPNHLEWVVQWQYQTGLIDYKIFCTKEEAKKYLEELRGRS